MADTESLIAQLSENAAAKPLAAPQHFIVRVLVVLSVYALGVQGMDGIRADFMEQWGRAGYVMELALLAAITISSVLAAIVSMYPDAYQRPALLKLPYVLFVLLLVFLAAQLMMPTDQRMVIRPFTFAGHGCTLYIAAITMLPSAMIFLLLRQGASVKPLQAGSFAVLASAGIGCLTLRLEEMNDSLPHLITYHYAPTLLFAALGAVAGKWLFRW